MSWRTLKTKPSCTANSHCNIGCCWLSITNRIAVAVIKTAPHRATENSCSVIAHFFLLFSRRTNAPDNCLGFQLTQLTLALHFVNHSENCSRAAGLRFKGSSETSDKYCQLDRWRYAAPPAGRQLCRPVSMARRFTPFFSNQRIAAVLGVLGMCRSRRRILVRDETRQPWVP